MEKIKKKYKKKNKNPVYKKRIFWIFILISVSTTILIAIFLFNSFYQLEEISIKGAKLTSEDSLRSKIERSSVIELPFLKSKSLVFLSTQLLETKIKSSLPHLEEISIEKIFPNKLEIDLKERRADFIWCAENDDCFEVDLSGIAFQGVDQVKDKIVVIDNLKLDFSLGDKVTSEERIKFINKAIFELVDAFDFKTKKIYIREERSLFLETENDFQIRFDFRSNLDNQIKRLDLLLEKEIKEVNNLDYIELRYGNQVFYKYD
jgi:cell division septal protein FtsQ